VLLFGVAYFNWLMTYQVGDGESQPRPDRDVEFSFLSRIVFFSGRYFFHEKSFQFGEGFEN